MTENADRISRSDSWIQNILDDYYNDRHNIVWPTQEKERQRAAGGRVVASNINHNPTEAQKNSGNYAKDHVNIHGLNLTIENAKGKYRSGVGKDGKLWKTQLPAHYGYVKGTEGADGDHVDIYLGPHTKSKDVFVVNQINADTKKFDEVKCLLGFISLDQAISIYLKGFSDNKGKDRLGSIVPTTMDKFKGWLKSGDTKKPYRKQSTYGNYKHKGITVEEQI